MQRARPLKARENTSHMTRSCDQHQQFPCVPSEKVKCQDGKSFNCCCVQVYWWTKSEYSMFNQFFFWLAPGRCRLTHKYVVKQFCRKPTARATAQLDRQAFKQIFKIPGREQFVFWLLSFNTSVDWRIGVFEKLSTLVIDVRTSLFFV